MLDLSDCLSDINRQGWGVVRSVALDADNAALIALGSALGPRSMQGQRPGSPNFENGGVNRVENMDTPMRDAVGKRMGQAAA